MTDAEKIYFEGVRRQKTNDKNIYQRIDYIIFCLDNVDKNLKNTSNRLINVEKIINGKKIF
jgi:hypothetical protein